VRTASGIFVSLLFGCLLLAAESGTLDFYFVDVEQGSAILAVSPSGESMLIDAGSRGHNGRDVKRVLAVAKEAGIQQIDYLLATHYHNDHYGAVPELAERIPIVNFIDHGANVEAGRSAEWHKHWQMGAGEELWAAYRAARSKGNHLVAKPRDGIPIKGIDVQVLTSAGKQIAEPLEGAGAPNPSCAITPLRSEDETEDGQSVGILITFGKFRFVFLGDLTWNKLHRLFCPNNLVGTVDVYVTTHHAMSIDRETGGPIRWGRSSSSEAEVHALRPRVAILNYGERYHRLGGPRGWRVVRNSPGLEDFWQMHYQVGGGKENNVPEKFIANLSAKNCQGHRIKLSAESSGSFTVTNARNGYRKSY
jgi:beta-lactamase superfamily II metal-dependent hydrolase